jgi:L-iditol 2-dehydrogenase
LAAEITRPKGTVALIGIPVEEHTTFRISTVRRNEITVIWVRRQNCNYPEAISLAERGLVALKPLVTHRFPLAQAQEAYELAEGKRDGAVRVVVEP